MSEKMASTDDDSPDGAEQAPAAPTPPKRGPGHRGQDVRDTMAEMAAKAHEISLEAGSRMTSTMREVVGAAAGLTVFAIESARDLVQYMVRRGQMSQDEADKLMREVETAHATSPRPLLKLDAPKSEAPRKSASTTPSSPVAPPPLSALDAEPPVVARATGAVAPEPLTEEDIASLPDPDAESRSAESTKDASKGKTAKDASSAKGSATKSAAKGTSSETASKAASTSKASKSATPKSATPKPATTKASGSKHAAKTPAKSATSATKPAAKKAIPRKK